MRSLIIVIAVFLASCGPASSQTTRATSTEALAEAYDFGTSKKHELDGMTVSIPESFAVEKDGISGFETVDDWIVPTVNDAISAKHPGGFSVRVDVFLQTNPQSLNVIVEWVEKDCKKLEAFAQEQGTVYTCEREIRNGNVTMIQSYELKDGKTQWVESTFFPAETTLWALTVTGRDAPEKATAFREFADSVVSMSSFEAYSNATKTARAVDLTQKMKQELK